LKQLLWYLLAGTRGGVNRIRIIEALLERPYNAHQLSEELELDYRTMRHHLDVLTKNHILARPEGKAYGSMYFVAGSFEEHTDVFDKIKDSIVGDSGKILAKGNKKANG